MTVKVRENAGVVWVMYRADDEIVRDLYVVVLDDEELVIVKVSGDLERLVTRALSEGNDIPGIPYIYDNDHEEDNF